MKIKDPATPMFTISATSTVAIKNMPDPPPLALHTVVVDDDGNLYCSDEFNHRIIVLSSEYEFIFSFGGRGAGSGQFWYPRGMAIANNGGIKTLFICDSWNHRIQQFDLKGNFISSFGSIGEGEENFDEPVAILSDSADDLLILDRNNGRVKKHSLDGAFISAFGKLLSRNNEDRLNDPEKILFNGEPPIHGYFYPGAFALLDDGSLLIADTGNRRICHVNAEGESPGDAWLDVDGAFPYTYPDLLIPFGGEALLVGGINTQPEFINIRLPWRSMPLDIDSDSAHSTAFLAKKLEDGSVELAIVDCRKEVVTRHVYSLCEAPALLPFPEASQMQKPPDRWTQIECDKWHSYLINAKPEKENSMMAKKFISTCHTSASASARKRGEAEGKMCNMMAEYYVALDNFSKANLAKQGENEAELRLQSLTLEYLREKRDRDVCRKVMINAIFKAIDLITSDAWKNELAPEAAKTTQLMKSEYEQRLKDYSEVMKWIKDNSITPDKLNILASANAFTAISFLLDHFSYIEKSISMLDESFIPEPYENKEFISTILLNHARDVRGIPTTIVSLIGQICAEFGYVESATAIYQHGIALNDDSKFVYVALYCNLLLAQRNKKDVLETIMPMIDDITTFQHALDFTSILQDCGDFASAQKLMERFDAKQQDDADLEENWARLEKRQKLFASPPMPSITLSAGQSSYDVLEETNVAGDCNLRYIRSIEMKHPTTGEPLQPYLILPIDESRLAVVNNIDPLRELFLYTLDKGCQPLLDEPAFITGMDVTSDGELIYTSLKKGRNFEAGSSVKLMDIKSGEVRDITNEVALNANFIPYKLYFAPDDNLIVYDTISGEIFSFDETLTKHKLIDTVAPGFNEVYMNGYKLVFSNRVRDNIYVYDILRKSGHYIDNSLVAQPTSGSFINDSTFSVVTKTGLQIYQNDEYVYQVSKLFYKDKTFSLKECFSTLSDASFGGGDLLISDYANKAIHIFAKL